jgi:hypothetical protein
MKNVAAAAALVHNGEQAGENSAKEKECSGK